MLILEFLSPKSDFFFFLNGKQRAFLPQPLGEMTLLYPFSLLFIYFWLHWVSVAAHRLPLVQCSFLITMASHCRARALEPGLGSSGARA